METRFATPRDGDDSTIFPTRAGEGEGVSSDVPALTILLHHDLRRLGKSMVLEPGESAVLRNLPPLFDTDDLVVARTPVFYVEFHRAEKTATLRRGPGATSVTVEGVSLETARDISSSALKRGVIITLGESIVLCLHLRRVPVLRGPEMGIVGNSDAIEEVRVNIANSLKIGAPVLIRGESGAGKELVANAIAAQAAPNGPFVTFSMADLNPASATAELFGHDKGSFTGAAEARPGRIAQANNGVLFLDEIAATPRELQVMLFRFIQEGEVWAVGAKAKRKITIRRLLTATDKDLEDAIERGSFERPLYERIKGFQITLPPLRERREDLGSLFAHFLESCLSSSGRTLASLVRGPKDLPWLRARDFARIARSEFSGNVRTFRRIVERLVATSSELETARLDAAIESDLASSMPVSARSPTMQGPQGQVRDRSMPNTTAVEEALALRNYNVAAAARDLNIHRSTVYERVRTNPGLLRKAESIPDEEILAAYDRHNGNLANIALDLKVPPKPLKSRVDALRQRLSRLSR